MAGLRDYNFVVKSNSIGTLQETVSAGTATFSGKCTIKAVDRLTGVTYDGGGNYLFQVDVTDRGEPGSGVANPDTYAIRITDSAGNNLIVVGTYSGSTNVTQVPLNGGNIQVK